jgi:hypothetical protein
VRPHAAWLVYGAAGLLCAVYLNARALLVPKVGQWYAADANPAVLLQLRAWLSGRLAPGPHPVGGWYDYVWGRGGMHSNFGVGLPMLSLPLHVVARLFGAPGFPDQVRFLVFYAITTALFTRALHRSSRREPTALIASAVAAVFVLAFPTFVWFLAARFLIYEQAIAVGALWAVLLLAGLLVLLERSTTPRLLGVCTAAAFTVYIRPPLAAYGPTTIALALFIAHRRGLRLRALAASLAAAVGVAVLYLVNNVVRFGSPFEAGYANIVSGLLVNRLTRWGVGFASVPFKTAAKELLATLFLLDPIATHIITSTPLQVPPSVAPFAVGERYREYYSPTYDRWVFAAWLTAFAIVAWRLVRDRPWRRDRDIGGEVTTIVGLWALPPSIVLFVFYAKIGNLVTRYLIDLYPAFAAMMLCVGMAVVDAVRKRAPKRVAAAQLAIAAVAAVYFYLSGGHGWVRQRSHPADRNTMDARLADIDARSQSQPIPPGHFECGAPRGPEPMYAQLAGWLDDCKFSSGMIFAMLRSPCVTFTFQTGGRGGWRPADSESLAGFRAHGDFDALVSCGPPKVEGETRTVTMCEPHSPRFLLDGMRLYSVATLDGALKPIDRLRLLRIDGVPACP